MSFLSLPSELRLQVYKELVSDCLANGHPHDITGLYVSCQQIHNELEHEHIRRVRRMLTCKHLWKTVNGNSQRLGLTVHERAALAKNDISIDITFNPDWNVVQMTSFVPGAPHFDWPSVPDNVIDILQPVCQNIWKKLEVNIHGFRPGLPEFEDPQAADLVEPFLFNLGRLPSEPERIAVNLVSYYKFDTGSDRAVRERISSEHEDAMMAGEQAVEDKEIGKEEADEETDPDPGLTFNLNMMSKKMFNLKHRAYMKFGGVPRKPIYGIVTRILKDGWFTVGFVFDFQPDIPDPKGILLKYLL